MVLNRSRDVVRQGLSYFPAEAVELKAMLCRWVMAFSRTLMCHLRKGSDVAAELKVRAWGRGEGGVGESDAKLANTKPAHENQPTQQTPPHTHKHINT